MGVVIAVANNKGGVLKTTTVTNLAGVASQNGQRVLIIDCDNQANVSLSFNLNPDQFETTLFDVLVDSIDPRYVIEHVTDNIDILPSNDSLSMLEFQILTNLNKFSKPFYLLRDMLKNIVNDYDVIFLDSPPNLGLVSGNILSFADEVLIPFQPESFSMRSLIKMLSAIDDFKQAHNPRLDILGVVGTLVNDRTILHANVLNQCRKYCDHKHVKMFDTIIPRSIRFASAVAFEGLPATLIKENKNNDIVNAYINLYNEVKEAVNV
ncbi:ParA family protein [Sporolactobacillus sp. CQH2019]|uniref:ParA family protein n=1 Tax=Sporolactobacillus sp. CQH2019 TaxID=3023512 RepID=UPI002367D85A|nr:ParA family protein [Sporolactobacillus sp. CQH2019]MDD9147343.1 ParA family protein [Sporolactobacillus sp. CQH2019]